MVDPFIAKSYTPNKRQCYVIQEPKRWTFVVFTLHTLIGLPWWFSGKKSTHNAGDTGLIPELERSPGERNGNSLQYSCLENPVDRGVGWATVHEVARDGHNLATKPSYSNRKLWHAQF